MLGELLHDEEVLFSVWLTLKVAAVCLALHLITAVPLALWARSPKAPFRRTLNFVVTLPLVFPPIALGYLLLGLAHLGAPLAPSAGTHLLAIGAMGLSILAVLCIAGRTHAGHPLDERPWVVVAAVSIALAAVLRAASGLPDMPAFALQLWLLRPQRAA